MRLHAPVAPPARLRRGRLWSPVRHRRGDGRATSALEGLHGAEGQGVQGDRQEAPARIRSCPAAGRTPRVRPSPARMQENSPICARAAATVSAVPGGTETP